MQELRSTLEIAYFVSGIIVAIAAIAGLYNIWLAKNTLKIQSERDALSLTASQCLYYSDKIIPLSNELTLAIESANCSYFDDENWDVDTEGLEITLKCNAGVVINVDILYMVAELLNSLDGFSIYFTSGLADESIAYRALSTIFIQMTEKYMPFALDANDKLGSYENLLELYVMWKNRKKEQQHHLQLNNLHKEMSENVVRNKKFIGS